MREFPLTNLLYVTGFCCLAFNAIMKFLDGNTIRIFLFAGIGGLVLGTLGLISSALLKKWKTARKQPNPQDSQFFQ